MLTTIQISENIKQQLKIKSLELGVEQIDLLNRYIIEGIERDSIDETKPPSIEEIKKLLDYDKPEGNNLEGFIGIIDDGEIIDPVIEKRKSYRGY